MLNTSRGKLRDFLKIEFVIFFHIGHEFSDKETYLLYNSECIS